jgi:hypothetical protein
LRAVGRRQERKRNFGKRIAETEAEAKNSPQGNLSTKNEFPVYRAFILQKIIFASSDFFWS